MTPPASIDPMHCDHECVCTMYIGREEWLKRAPCNYKCDPSHDTRNRGPVQGASAGQCQPNTPLCDECYKEQIEHDAALIAQAIAEDRKLRPRPPCEECNWQERLEKEKAQAREDVLNAIAQEVDLLYGIEDISGNAHKKLVGMINSLRSEVGK